MTSVRLSLLVSFILLAASPRPASAGFETIEWTVSDADMVVVGLLERPTRPGIGRVRVIETIKGIPADSLTFIYATNVQEQRVSACTAPMLLSVKSWKRHFGTDPVPGVPGCVLIPTSCDTSAVALDGTPPQPRTHPLLGPCDPDQLLRRARRAAHASKDGQAKPFPVQTDLADSNGWLLHLPLYVLLPANESALEVLGSWISSDQLHARAHAARLIGVLGHPDGIPYLLSLLNDPFVDPGGWDEFSEPDGWRWRFTRYPIRQAAWNSLLKLGYDGPAPLIRQPILGRRPLPLSAALLAAFPLAVGLLAAVRRSRRRAFNGACAASATLMIGVALLLPRSYWKADDLALDGNDRLREFWSHEGGLHFLEAGTANPPRPWSWGQFDAKGPLRPMWELNGTPAAGASWGFSTRAAVGPSFSGHLGLLRIHRVPHWAAIGLFAVLPLLWLRSAYAAVVHPWRGRPGFCRTCGYDLRATPLRCPECGTEVQRRQAFGRDPALPTAYDQSSGTSERAREVTAEHGRAFGT